MNQTPVDALGKYDTRSIVQFLAKQSGDGSNCSQIAAGIGDFDRNILLALAKLEEGRIIWSELIETEHGMVRYYHLTRAGEARVGLKEL